MSAPDRTKELLESAKAALLLAKKHGANDAAVNATTSRDVTTVWRDGKLEKISDATSRSLALGLYVDGRYGSMSTSDLRPDAVDAFVRDAVGLVKALAKDPHRKLPPPALYAGRTTTDLGIFDPSIESLTAERRLARAKEMEEGARSAKGKERITSVSASVSDSLTETARVTSNGFEDAYRSTSFDCEVESSLKDDDGRRPSDWAAGSARFYEGLPAPAALGREATERAAARLGAQKIKSGTMTVIVEARAARTLLRHLIAPLSGAALQQKESFLEGKVGKQVASTHFTLSDEPHRPRGLASRPFDGEGMATKPRVLIERGKLLGYFLDVYYASKLGLAPTTRGPSNLVVLPSKATDVFSKVKDGVLVTSFLGGNSNSTTGVFSLGFSGFRLAGGERREPIAEMNLSGSHVDFWKRLALVGDDPYLASATITPSLVFEGVAIAGT